EDFIREGNVGANDFFGAVAGRPRRLVDFPVICTAGDNAFTVEAPGDVLAVVLCQLLLGKPLAVLVLIFGNHAGIFLLPPKRTGSTKSYVTPSPKAGQSPRQLLDGSSAASRSAAS